jgi:hypothetical protein
MSARIAPPPARGSTLKGIKGWEEGGPAKAGDARRKGQRPNGTLSPGPSPLQGEGSPA